MTIVRLNQAAFESRFRGETLAEEIGTATDIFEADPYSGVYALDIAIGITPYGFGFEPVSQLRAGFWLKHTNATSLSNGYVVLFNIRRSNDDAKHAIRWYRDQDRLSLVIDDVVVESVCASSAQINRNNHWMHCGVHAKSGADGFLSFYLNGKIILNYEGDLGSEFVSVFCGGQDSSSGNWTAAVLDDLYVDSTEGEDDGPAPALRFYPSSVVGTGTDFEWIAVGESSTFQCVQNNPLVEDELAFATEADLVDSHLMTNVTLLGQEVHAVIPYVVCRKTNPEIDSTLSLHLFDGVLYEESAEFQPGIGFSYFWDRQVLQPDGSGWNETDANSMEMGYSSKGVYI